MVVNKRIIEVFKPFLIECGFDINDKSLYKEYYKYIRNIDLVDVVCNDIFIDCVNKIVSDEFLFRELISDNKWILSEKFKTLFVPDLKINSFMMYIKYVNVPESLCSLANKYSSLMSLVDETSLLGVIYSYFKIYQDDKMSCEVQTHHNFLIGNIEYPGNDEVNSIGVSEGRKCYLYNGNFCNIYNFLEDAYYLTLEESMMVLSVLNNKMSVDKLNKYQQFVLKEISKYSSYKDELITKSDDLDNELLLKLEILFNDDSIDYDKHPKKRAQLARDLFDELEGDSFQITTSNYSWSKSKYGKYKNRRKYIPEHKRPR